MKPSPHQLVLLAAAITTAIVGLASPAEEPAGADQAPAESAQPAPEYPGNEYFVSLDGSVSGNGSRSNPWLLTQVLTDPPDPIQPGDVIWVRGGVYRGPFVSHLSGSADAPVTLRAYREEHVQLDLYNPKQWEQGFFVLGDFVTYQGFEVTNSNRGPRTTDQSGPFQTEVNRGGISVRGHNNRFVNLVVHDLNAGIGYWGDGGEIHGSILYNNGWKAPDRQHGHGLYLQNQNGVKLTTDNIIFNQFGAGIHAFGTRAGLNNMYFEGNVSFNNGAGVGQGFSPERDFLVGGSTVTRNATLRENFTFQNDLDGVVDVGYLWGPQNEDISFTDNYFVGSVRFLQPFSDVVFCGNTIVSERPIALTTPQDRVIGDFHWDDNRYVTGDSLLFRLDYSARDWQSWRDSTGLDIHSALVPLSTRPEVFVRPNQYEPGRANIIVYNWGQASEVDLDLSSVLKAGDSYELVSAMDFYGEPVHHGTFDGSPIKVPMINRPASSPVGYSGAAPVGTDARFGVFVVRTAGTSAEGEPPKKSPDDSTTNLIP